MPQGRPTAFKPEMITKASEYIEGGYEENGEATPSTVGLAIHIGVAKSTMYKWIQDDENHPFSDSLAMCNDYAELKLRSGGLSGKFNPAITKLILHNHGYHEKVDQDITSGGKPVNEWHMHPTAPKGEDD